MKTTLLTVGFAYLCAAFGLLAPERSFNAPKPSADTTRFDSNTGFVVAEGIELVRAHCTGCHSPKLVTQYRASREGWLDRIRWMQRTQNLWDLGSSEEAVLTYLSTHYGPIPKTQRRAPLSNVTWYELKKP